MSANDLNAVALSIATVLAGFSTLVGGLIIAVNKIRELKKSLRRKVTIIGVVSGSKTPAALNALPEFSDYSDACQSSKSAVILYCRNLSYALKTCDFVCYKGGTDPKVHDPTDDTFWTELTYETS